MHTVDILCSPSLNELFWPNHLVCAEQHSEANPEYLWRGSPPPSQTFGGNQAPGTGMTRRTLCKPVAPQECGTLSQATTWGRHRPSSAAGYQPSLPCWAQPAACPHCPAVPLLCVRTHLKYPVCWHHRGVWCDQHAPQMTEGQLGNHTLQTEFISGV